MNIYRILLVDDDPFFLKMYGDFLRSHGFEVDTAERGEAALEMFQDGTYQLVVVDLVMPGMNGFTLIERIHAHNPAQDILVVTGTDDVRTAVRTMRLGVYDYLVKPVEREELLHVIDRLQERATLYDEHARLVQQNIQYAETQRIFQHALRILNSLELETVCERLLETLSEICNAQGAALWLGRDDTSELSLHGYRGLIEAGRLAMSWDPLTSSVANELAQGVPLFVGRDLATITRQGAPSESLLCPLARGNKLIGMVQLVDKLGGGFGDADAAYAKILSDAGGTAIAHARRFRQLERVGLRDPSTSAYNMTYFIDYLGRELHKARRYQRSFALVQMSIDSLGTLKQSLRPEVYTETLRRLVVAVSSVLREIDVLARVTDEEMYLLLPETDFLGGLTFTRTARDALARSSFLADIDREQPISVCFGPAAVPRDGDDVDQLFAACKRRLQESRRSMFRRLHLEDADFWGAADLLIGDEHHYSGNTVELSRTLAVTEDSKGMSRHHVFPPGFVDLLRREVVTEASRPGRSGGWLFVGGRWDGDAERVATLFGGVGGGQVRAYVLGNESAGALPQAPAVTAVRVEGDAFLRHEVILLLSEHASYGLLARRRADGRAYGFHTADWTLVEGLIGKLQDAYHLQKAGA